MVNQALRHHGVRHCSQHVLGNSRVVRARETCKGGTRLSKNMSLWPTWGVGKHFHTNSERFRHYSGLHISALLERTKACSHII